MQTAIVIRRPPKVRTPRGRGKKGVGGLSGVHPQQLFGQVLEALRKRNGFDPADGAATRHEDEASVNRLLCERARRVVIAADASKLGVRAFARICATSSVDVLVTDTGLAAEVAQEFAAAGVEVLRV